jgi:TolB-like protein
MKKHIPLLILMSLVSAQFESLTPQQLQEYERTKLTVESVQTAFGSASIRWEAYYGFEKIPESTFFEISGYEDEASKALERLKAIEKREQLGKRTTFLGCGVLLYAIAKHPDAVNMPPEGALSMLLIYSGLLVGVGATTEKNVNWAPYEKAVFVAEEYNSRLLSDIKSKSLAGSTSETTLVQGTVKSFENISSSLIAVLDFEGNDISPSEARALTDRLRSELVGTGQFTIIERGKMEEVLKEQAFQQTGCVSSECAVEVGKLLSVKNIIIGSISRVGSINSVTARVVSIESGEIIKSTVYDHSGDIGGLLTQGMRKVAEELGK